MYVCMYIAYYTCSISLDEVDVISTVSFHYKLYHQFVELLNALIYEHHIIDIVKNLIAIYTDDSIARGNANPLPSKYY